MPGTVIATSASASHTFSKVNRPSIELVSGIGVQSDAHAGVRVRHRSRAARDPDQPNLRQVHLIQSELFAELQDLGFVVGPGDVGENITTAGIDLLDLPTSTRLRIGSSAVIEMTGLRNPCVQLDRFQDGLMSAVLDRDGQGRLIRKSGVMAIVLVGGRVAPGDDIEAEHPSPPYRPLQPV